MEKHVIEKLNEIVYSRNPWKNWSLEEQKTLLEIYLAISKKESYIFDLIWSLHGCDSWEDIFRDYNYIDFEDKISGVEVALDTLKEKTLN